MHLINVHCVDAAQQHESDSNCNDILETSWSVLFNLSDATPRNSERFLATDGLNLLYKCAQVMRNRTRGDS